MTTDPSPITSIPEPWELPDAVITSDDYPELIESLLARGAPIDGTIDDRTALMEAAYRGHEETVRLLLDKGATVIIGDKNAFVMAAEAGHVEIVRMFLNKDPQLINTKGGPRKDTALIRAAYHGKEKVVRLLVERGAAIDETDLTGATALNRAKREGFSNIVKLLTDAPLIQQRIAESRQKRREMEIIQQSRKVVVLQGNLPSLPVLFKPRIK